MLKAEELRIRNIVRDKRSKQEEVINELSIDGYNAYNSYGEHVKFYLEDIEGIPLTEGWLLRMGFEKNSEYYSYSNEFVPLVIIYDSEESRVYIQGAEDELRLSSRMFKNVHELQNLVFTILGTELTIKE